MEYKIKLDMSMDANSLNTLLGALGSGPHNFVRPIIDNILALNKVTQESNRLRNWSTLRRPFYKIFLN